MEQYKQEFIEFMVDCNVLKFGDFVTKSGRKIGCKEDKEGRIHLESNAWAILSGAADAEKDDKLAGEEHPTEDSPASDFP